MKVLNKSTQDGEYFPECLFKLEYQSSYDDFKDRALVLPGGNHDSPLYETKSLNKIMGMI
jgi:hypothetical protein